MSSNQKIKWYSQPTFTPNILAAMVTIILLIVITVAFKYVLDGKDVTGLIWFIILIVVMYVIIYLILLKFFEQFRAFLMRKFRIIIDTDLSMKLQKDATIYFSIILLISVLLMAFFVYFYPSTELIKPLDTTTNIQKTDVNTIDGFLALSGIMFAVQMVFIVNHKDVILRGIFKFALLLEVILLCCVAFRYLTDILDGIFPSEITLFFVSFSLFFTIIITGVLIVVDLFYHQP
ncbi:MAG: hypothetical protein FWD52_09315 [Candidatus Bathyarchaeota archaeon]|nr:hypothetical protein [Candidatus Termiticorpusculum sp.]